MRMAKDEFKAELDDYLAERKTEPILAQIFRKREKSDEPPIEEDYPLEDVGSQESWWTRFSKRFSSQKEHQEHDEEVLVEDLPKDELRDDFKEMSKITLQVMKQLPEKELHRLKQGPQFARFKEILKKHNLIK